MKLDERTETERPRVVVQDSSRSYVPGLAVSEEALKRILYQLVGYCWKRVTQAISTVLWRLFCAALVVTNMLQLIYILGS